jgi:hypothetical protein
MPRGQYTALVDSAILAFEWAVLAATDDEVFGEDQADR